MIRGLQNLEDRTFNRAGPQDDGPKCCFCFPMKCGIIMIGVSIGFDATQTLLMIMPLWNGLSAVAAVCYALAAVPETLAFNLFLVYLCKDSRDTRRNLPLACALMMAANVMEFSGVIVGSVFDEIPGSFITNCLFKNAFSLFIYWYFRMICFDWYTMLAGGRQEH